MRAHGETKKRGAYADGNETQTHKKSWCISVEGRESESLDMHAQRDKKREAPLLVANNTILPVLHLTHTTYD